MPGSKSTRTARGTYFPPEPHQAYTWVTCSKKKKKKLKIRTKLTWSLIVINIDSLKLKVAVTDVFALWIYSMFIGNDLPELIKNARDLLSIRHIQKKPIKKLVWTGTASWRANPTRNRGLEPATQGSMGVVGDTRQRPLCRHRTPTVMQPQKGGVGTRWHFSHFQRFNTMTRTQITLEPIWLPHWPAWRWTISRILMS